MRAVVTWPCMGVLLYYYRGFVWPSSSVHVHLIPDMLQRLDADRSSAEGQVMRISSFFFLWPESPHARLVPRRPMYNVSAPWLETHASSKSPDQLYHRTRTYVVRDETVLAVRRLHFGAKVVDNTVPSSVPDEQYSTYIDRVNKWKQTTTKLTNLQPVRGFRRPRHSCRCRDRVRYHLPPPHVLLRSRRISNSRHVSPNSAYTTLD